MKGQVDTNRPCSILANSVKSKSFSRKAMSGGSIWL